MTVLPARIESIMNAIFAHALYLRYFVIRFADSTEMLFNLNGMLKYSLYEKTASLGISRLMWLYSSSHQFPARTF